MDDSNTPAKPQPTRTRTKEEIALIFGRSKRTITDWVARGCPSTAPTAGAPRLFSEEEVRAWQQSRAAQDQGSQSAQGNLAKAELARRLMVAKKSELELTAAQALKDLGLDLKILAAKSYEDFVLIDLEIGALLARGALTPARARAIQSVIADARQNTKAHQEAGGDEEPERVVLLSDEGVALVEDFEAIVSDERRARVLAHVAQERAVDEEESPNLDLAAMSPEEARELGLDPDDLQTEEEA